MLDKLSFVAETISKLAIPFLTDCHRIQKAGRAIDMQGRRELHQFSTASLCTHFDRTVQQMRFQQIIVADVNLPILQQALRFLNHAVQIFTLEN